MPVYEILECKSCVKDEFKYEIKDCLGGGRYCAFDPDGNTSVVQGRDILDDILVQLCVFNEFGVNSWFDYMSEFYRYCENPFSYKQCSILVSTNLNLNYQTIQNCVETSFIKNSFSD